MTDADTQRKGGAGIWIIAIIGLIVVSVFVIAAIEGNRPLEELERTRKLAEELPKLPALDGNIHKSDRPTVQEMITIHIDDLHAELVELVRKYAGNESELLDRRIYYRERPNQIIDISDDYLVCDLRLKQEKLKAQIKSLKEEIELFRAVTSE